jgi:hypothetical protein
LAIAAAWISDAMVSLFLRTSVTLIVGLAASNLSSTRRKASRFPVWQCHRVIVVGACADL